MTALVLAALAILATEVHPNFASAATAASQTDLRLEKAGRMHTVSLKELRKKLPVSAITVEDPVYKKRKTYEGFPLGKVLAIAGLLDVGGDEIVFHCKDGYAPSMPLARLREALGRGQAMVAFREKGRSGGWEPFKQGKSTLTPAPYYLVWDSTDSALPWPYQLVRIEVIEFRSKYDRLFPAGEEPTSAAYRGFEVFRRECVRCHSINLQGGDLGPELNLPRNILEYRDENSVVEFIRNPEAFRLRSRMPAFPNLAEPELQDLLAYLRWAREHKKPQ